MSNEEIEKKYGVEPIMKEMWVWDERPEAASFTLVMHKRVNYLDFPYTNLHGAIFKNASDTNPNEKKSQVGDVGYFWNDEEVFYAYGHLMGINNKKSLPYLCEGLSWHTHFSHEKQLWMQ